MMVATGAVQSINPTTNVSTVEFFDANLNLIQENIGGNRPSRNNNPGSISAGAFANNNGAIGADYVPNLGSLAIFPDFQTGLNAQITLLHGSSYSSLSIDDAVNKYTKNPDGTPSINLSGYQNAVVNAANAADQSNPVSHSSTLSSLTTAQWSAAINAFDTSEGYYSAPPLSIFYSPTGDGGVKITRQSNQINLDSLLPHPFFHQTNPGYTKIVEITDLDSSNNIIGKTTYSTPVPIIGAPDVGYVNNTLTLQYGGGPGQTAVTATIAPNGVGTFTKTDSNGNITNTPLASPNDLIGQVANVFGSALGNVLGGNNPFEQIAVSSILGASLQGIANLVENSNSSNFDLVAQNLLDDFPTSVEAAGAGALGAYLISAIVSATGLTGLPADLLDTAAGYAISTIANNVILGVDPITGIDAATGELGTGAVDLSDIGSWEAVGGAFIGNEIAHAIYQPNTLAGEEGAQVTEAIGEAILFASFDTGNPYIIVAAAVVAILADIVGGLLGDLFGQQHTSHISEANLSFSGGGFVFQTSSYQNGPIDDAQGAGEALSDTLNRIIAAVGGIVTNASSLTQFGVGFNTDASGDAINPQGGFAYYYDADGIRTQYWQVNTPMQQVIDYALLHEISEMEFTGGDPYVERAIDAAFRSSSAPTSETLAGFIQIAKDYENYEANQTTINAFILADPENPNSIGWIAELATARAMGFGTSVQGGTWDDNISATGTQKILIGGGSDANGDTYTVNAGNGDVTILNGVSTYNVAEGSLNLGAGLSFSGDSPQDQTTFTQSGQDLVIDFAGDSTDQVTVEGWFADSFAQLGQISFNNGAQILSNTWVQYYANEIAFTTPQGQIPYLQSLTDLGVAGNNAFANSSNTLAGGVGEDVLTGNGGNNTFVAGGGNDVIYGGGGNDTYEFNAAGALTINNGVNNGGTVIGTAVSGTLSFGAGVAFNQLSFAQTDNDLTISLAGSSSQVTVAGWFANAYSKLQAVTTADGYTITPEADGTFLSQPMTDDIYAGGFKTITWKPGQNYTYYIAHYQPAQINPGEIDFYNGPGSLFLKQTFAADGSYTDTNYDANGNATGSVHYDSAGHADPTQTSNSYNISTSGVISLSGMNITAIAGVTETITGDNNAITLNNSADAVTVNGAGDHVTLGNAVSSTTLSGSSLWVTLGNSDTVSVNGSNNSIALNGTSDALTISGTGDTISGTHVGAISMGTGSSATVTSTGNSISETGSDTVTDTAGSNAVALSGASNVLNGSSETVTMSASSASATVNGNNNHIAVSGTSDTLTLTGANDVVAVTGNNAIISASPGTQVSFGNGLTATIHGTGLQIGLSDSDNVTVTDGYNAINADTGNVISATGDHGEVTLSGGSNTATLYGNYDTLYSYGSSNTVATSGTGDTIVSFGTESSLTVNGTGEHIEVNGNNTTVSASDGSVQISAGLTAKVDGDRLSISVLANVALTVNGNADAVGFDGASDSLTLNGIINATTVTSGTGGPSGTINLAAVSHNDLSFARDGNDLLIYGGANRVTMVTSWFASDASKVQSIVTADGFSLGAAASTAYLQSAELDHSFLGSIWSSTDTSTALWDISNNAWSSVDYFYRQGASDPYFVKTNLRSGGFYEDVHIPSGGDGGWSWYRAFYSTASSGSLYETDEYDPNDSSFLYRRTIWNPDGSYKFESLDGAGNVTDVEYFNADHSPSSGPSTVHAIYTSGSGIAISNANVTVGSTISATVEGTNDTLSVGDNSTVYLNAAGGSDSIATNWQNGTTFYIGAFSSININSGEHTIYVTGTGVSLSSWADTINLAVDTNSTITGSYQTINAVSGDTVSMGSSGDLYDTVNVNTSGGTAVVNLVTSSGSVVNFGANSNGTVNGTGDTVYVNGYGDNVTVGSSYVYVAAGIIATLGGSSNTVYAGNGAYINSTANGVNIAAGQAATINGVSNTVTAANGGLVTVTGGWNAVVLNSGSNSAATFGAGASGTVSGTGNTVYITGNSDSVTVSSNTVNVSAGILATILGSGNTINAGNASGVYVSSNTINIAANTYASIVGASNTINVGVGGALIVNSGSGSDTVNLTANGGSSVHLVADAVATVNGAGNIVYLDGSGASVTTSSETVYLAAGASATVTGSGNIVALTGSGSTITATSQTVNLSAGVTGTINGSGNIVNASNASVVYGSSDTINIAAGTYASVIGASNTITLGAGSAVFLNSASGSDTIVMSANSGSSAHLNASAIATVTGNGNFVYLDGTGASLTASHQTVTVQSGLTATVNGSSNTINTANGDTVMLASGTGDVVNIGANATETIGLVANSGATVNLGTGSSATVTGSGNAVNIVGSGSVLTASSETVNVSSGIAATIIGSGDTVNMTGSGSVLTASGETINISSGITTTITGSGDTIVITGSGSIVTASADTVNVSSGVQATITGSSDTINLGSGASLNLTGGAGNVINASNDAVTLGAGASATISGSGDAITLSNGSIANIGAGGSDTIVGTGSDTLVYSGAHQSYSLTENVGSGSYTLLGPNGTDTISGVKQINFSDGYVSFDPTGNAAFLYSQYVIALGRAPDPVGFLYGVLGLDAGTVTRLQLANSALTSSEFAGDYGTLTNQGLVDRLYQNAFHQSAATADPTDEQYLIGQLNSGAMTPADVLLWFINNPQFIAATQGIVQQGIWTGNNPQGTNVSDYFSATGELIQGGAGNDTLFSDGVANTFNGAGGVNTISYLRASAGVTVNLAAGTDSIGDTLLNIQNAMGSAFNDVITGGLGAEVLTGGGGTDTITAGSGMDTVISSGASDTLIASSGSDTLIDTGTSTRINLSAGTGYVVNVAGGTINAGTGTQLTLNGDGNVINATGGAITLTAASVNGDTFNLSAGSILSLADNGAGGADDAVFLSNGTVNVASNSTADINGINNQINLVQNGRVGIESSGGDTLTASGTGSFVQVWTGTADVLNFSNGTLYLNTGVQVSLNGGNDAINANAGGFTIALAGTNGQADTLTASGTTTTLAANVQVNVVGSNNTINASTGDTISVSGGTGNVINSTGSGDKLTIASGAGLVAYSGASTTVNLATGTAKVNGSSASDTLIGIGIAQVSGSSDTLIGGTGTNTLIASGSADTLVGGPGTQKIVVSGTGDIATMSATGQLTVNSSGGADTITAGTGSTVMVSGNGQYGSIDAITVSNGFVTVADYTRPSVYGTGDQITAGNYDVVAITGNNNTLSAGVAANLFVEGGTGDIINDSSGYINLEAGNQATVNGNNNTLLAIAGGAFTATLNGTGDIIDANNNNLTLLASSSATLNGNGNTIALNGASDVVTLNGTNEIVNVNATAGGTINFVTNASATINGSYNTIGVNGTNIAVNGYRSTLNMTAGSALTLNGWADVVNMASNASVYVSITDGTSDTINMNGSADTLLSDGAYDTVDVFGGSNNKVTVTGVNDVVWTNGADTGTNITLSGSTETAYEYGSGTVTIAGTNDVSILHGTGAVSRTTGADTGTNTDLFGNYETAYLNGVGETVALDGNGNVVFINGVSATINMNNNNTAVVNFGVGASGVVNGSQNTIYETGNDNVTISPGNTDTVVFSGTGNTLSETGGKVTLGATGVGATINGNNDTLTVSAASDVISVNGSGDTVIATGAGDTLIGGGLGTTFTANSGSTFLFSQSSGTVSLAAGSAKINGSSTSDMLIGVSVSQVSGASDTLIGGSSVDTLIASGTGDTLVAGTGADTLISAAAANTISIANGTNHIVNASGDIVTMAAGTQATIAGNNDTLYAIAGGAFLATLNGTGNVVDANNNTLTLASGASVTINGSGNTLVASGGATTVNINDVGGTDTLTPVTNSGSVVNVSANSNVTVYDFTNTINVNGTGATVASYYDIVNVVPTGAVSWINGDGNTVNASGSGDTLYLGNTADTVNANSATIYMRLGPITVNGTGDTINVTSNGLVLNINDAGGADTVNLVSASGLTVNVAANSTATVNGNSNLIALAATGVAATSGNSNIMRAGSGTGTLSASGSGDTLIGGSGVDTLIASGLNDTLAGNLLGSQLTGDSSTQAIYGQDSATVNLAAGTAKVNGSSMSDALIGIGLAQVSGNSDTLIGGSSTNTLLVSGSGDTLIAGTAIDTLLASGANDTLVGNVLGSTLTGNSSTQAFYSQTNVVVNLATGNANVGGAGPNDTMVGITDVQIAAGNGTLIGGVGRDTLIANGVQQTLVAGSGADVLISTSGSLGNFNQLFGNLAGSTLIGTSANNWSQLNYNQNNATVNLSTGLANSNGSSVHDTLIGLSFAQVSGAGDTLIGGNSSTSTLIAAGSGDTLTGTSYSTLQSNLQGNTLIGDSTTQADYSVASATINLATGIASVNGSGVSDALIGVTNVLVAGTNDTVIGGSGSDTLLATRNAGHETLIAGSGANFLQASGALNTLIAGTGAVEVLLSSSGNNQLFGGSGSDTLISNGSGTLTAGSGLNTLLATGTSTALIAGGGTNEVLISTGSANKLIAGSGTSTLVSNGGGNTLIAGTGPTIVEYTPGSGATVNLSTGTALSDTLIGITAVSLLNSLYNTLIGGSGNDTLISSTDSYDTLIAGSGNNVLIGGGYDTLIGGAGTDTLEAGSYNTLIAGSGTTTLLAAIGGRNVLIGGSGADIMIASANLNTLIGGGGADTLIASSLHDVLIGGGGTDTLTASGNLNTLTTGSGTDTLIASGTSDYYQVASTNGSATIFNGQSSNTTASNELDFGTGLSDQNLWFVHTGNDLQIDLMGTSKEVTVKGWFSSTGDQLSEITANGLKLDAQLSSLVAAMATYSSSHTGFDPTATSTAPGDTTLQNAIAAAWHS